MNINLAQRLDAPDLMEIQKVGYVLAKTLGIIGESILKPRESVYLKLKWARAMVQHLNMDIETQGYVSRERPLIFVGNHLSYLDIVVLMRVVDDISFVAKSEIAKWPVFGLGAKRARTVFVNRNCKNSRQEVRRSIERSLLKDKVRVAVFPSGTTCLSEKTFWRRGIFEIAHQLSIPIQPFRMSYRPLRDAAFVEDDNLMSHMRNLFRLSHLEAKIEFHDPVEINEPNLDCRRWHEWASKFLTQT